MDVLERQTVVEGPLAAQPRLHAVPPAVIGARETDDQFPPRVEARQAHGGHHRLGTAHVKRHFVHAARWRFRIGNVLGDDRMERPQHRAQVLDPLPALFDPLLVTVEARDVDAVGTAHVDRPVAVEVSQTRPVRSGDHRAKVEFLAHHARERKRHSIGVGETEIRKAVADRLGPSDRLA